MRRLSPFLSVIGAAAVLVLIANGVSVAATGKPLLLGKSNAANKVTAVTRTTAGPALKVTTRTSANPPFAVNGRGRVGNLNADLLDGKDAAALQTRSYVFTAYRTTPANSIDLTDLAVPAGTYLVSYSAFFVGANDADAACFLSDGSGDQLVGEERVRTAVSGVTGAVSGSGLMTLVGTEGVDLYCSISKQATVPDYQPVQVVATRVDEALVEPVRNLG